MGEGVEERVGRAADGGDGTPFYRGWLNELKTLGVVLGFFALLLAIYGAFWSEDDRLHHGQIIAGFVARNWLVIAILAGIIAVTITLWRTSRLASADREIARLRAELSRAREDLSLAREQIRILQDELERLRAECGHHINYSKFDRGRWFNIKEVNIGWIPYPPLLRPSLVGDPDGAGVDLLKELLKPLTNLHFVGKQSKWEDFEKELNGTDGSFGLVATPLISTFERTKSMAFSAPLFYTNIGLFVSKTYADNNVFVGHNAKLKGIGLRHTAMEELLKSGALKLTAIEGEISQNVAQRYIPTDRQDELIDATVTTQGGLFAAVADSAGKAPVAVFSESIFQNFDPRKDEVVNILAPGKILYPVCYALRQADFQLKNLINVRLLKMEGGGALKWVAKRLAKDYGISEADVYRHYVDRWPYDPAATAKELKDPVDA